MKKDKADIVADQVYRLTNIIDKLAYESEFRFGIDLTHLHDDLKEIMRDLESIYE